MSAIADIVGVPRATRFPPAKKRALPADRFFYTIGLVDDDGIQAV